MGTEGRRHWVVMGKNRHSRCRTSCSTKEKLEKARSSQKIGSCLRPLNVQRPRSLSKLSGSLYVPKFEHRQHTQDSAMLPVSSPAGVGRRDTFPCDDHPRPQSDDDGPDCLGPGHHVLCRCCAMLTNDALSNWPPLTAIFLATTPNPSNDPEVFPSSIES